jgi:hypothetical protein
LPQTYKVVSAYGERLRISASLGCGSRPEQVHEAQSDPREW